MTSLAAARPWRRWVLDGVVGVALPLAVGLSQLPQWRPGPAAVYDWAGGEVRAGRFRPELYDDAYALQATLNFNHGQGQDILSPTPPTLLLFIVPFQWLPAWALAGVWLGLDILAPFLAVWLTLKAVELPSLPLAGLCASLLLLSGPIWENNLRGQVLHWQMLLFALALFSLARGRETLAGVNLGLAFLMKLAGWPVWLALALRGHWRALMWIAVIAASLALVGLPWIGLGTWWFYLTSVLPRWAQTPIAVVPAYQTVGGFWQHLFRYDAALNPAPVANLPWLATTLTIASSLALLGLSLPAMRHAPLLMAVSAGLVLTVLLAPIAEQYHYLTAALALIVAGVEWYRQMRGADPFTRQSHLSGTTTLHSPLHDSQLSSVKQVLLNAPSSLGHPLPFREGGRGVRSSAPLALLLLVSSLLMFLPIPYKDPRLAAGWLALLAYPRLWGGLLLWGGLVALGRGGLEQRA